MEEEEEELYTKNMKIWSGISGNKECKILLKSMLKS